ncbi:MAG: histidinol-phosphate transaminase [Candidatus Eremiobacteraeota bacterium]|nr:histidinol-phosphate transaminase [Candidatus Eremiobacteraeota bacterium]
MQPPLDRLLRSSLRAFAPYKPGTSVDEVRRRYGIEHPVKLSQNENPLGSSPKAMAALHAIADLSAYIEDDHAAVRERLARPHGLGVEHVVLGHGSNELVQVLFNAFVDPGDEVVMGKPTFSLFRKDADLAGGRSIEVPLRDGVHDLDAMLAAVTARTKLVFVCDPNNPTGTRVERAALFAFARALPPDVLLVIDQAYREFMDADGTDGVDVLRERPMTVVLRTASKIYGLAAIRFGYAYGSPEIVDTLNRVRLPFNVAGPAAAAVLAALDDREFFARSIETNERGKRQLYAAFERLGVHAYPTAANFIAVATPIDAQAAYLALLERGVIVRSGDGLGMPGYLRVTVGTEPENAAFVAAFEALLAEWRRRPVEAAR